MMSRPFRVCPPARSRGRASVLLSCFLRLAAFPCVPETRTFISARGGGDRERRTPLARPMRTIPSSTFQGCFQLLRHDRVGRSSGRSVVHTPRHWETGRPRAAQFALWAVYIPGGGTTWCGRRERRMVTADLLSRARAGDGEAFRELAGSHRRELQVHCYRMLGSFADAEDAVQETMLAAWQGIGGFTEERASLRTWLYKIATNRCLNARRAASRRPARKWDMSQFEALVALLTGDIFIAMPPEPFGYEGRDAVARYWARQFGAGRRFDLVPTRANGQPAFGAYLRVPAGIRHAAGFYVLTLAGDRICAMTRFEASVLPWFGLPRSLPAR